MVKALCRWIARRRCVITLAYSVIIIFVVSIISGGYQYLFSLSFDRHYKHWGPSAPLLPLVHQLKENATPDVSPINKFNYCYSIKNEKKCEVNEDTIRLVYVVKSSLQNFYRRDIIRQSWGYEQRFSDVIIRTVFLVGIRPDETHLQVRLNKENRRHLDIVQANFIDNYYNNTVKTMMGLDWAHNYCANAKYFLFVDDDYYVSTRNMLRFLRDPKNYPQYLQTYIASSVNEYKENLYAGYVFQKSLPKRWLFSKWYVSLEEYPYSHYPPYVTAGAYVLSRRSLHTMFYASLYTKPFKFDDIFLGMCAMKGSLKPFHHPEFHFVRPRYSIESFRYTIASHGFDDPDEMHKIWAEQRSVGNT